MRRIYDQAFAAVAKGRAFLHIRTRSPKKCHPSSRPGAVAGGNASRTRRALSIALVVSLLATSTPAAPQTIIGVGTEWKASLAFWLRANRLPARLRQALTGQTPARPRAQERQEERDARVARLRIYPGDTTIGLDDRVLFVAVAYDSNSAPVAGVEITWSANDRGGNLGELVSQSGEFEGKIAGAFRITAQAAGKTAQALVTVLPTPGRPKPNDPPLGPPRRVSTRDLPSLTSSGKSTSDGQLSVDGNPQPVSGSEAPAARLTRGRLTQRSVGDSSRRMRQLRAHAGPLLLEDGWGSDNYTSADDPGNGRGDPPGHPLDNGAGSGNFQISAPVLGLPGRGIDISLGLSYNSRVWNKAGNVINFDIDRDWPAPGWSLGFGKIADMGLGGSMIIDADGTRHAFKGTIGPFSGGQLFTGHTVDGTLINYSTWRNASGVMTWGEVNMPNGSQIHYYCAGPGGVFPTQVIDANGNYINITYVNNTGPRIQTISDTLGRVILFYYDYRNLLTAITTPGLDGGERTLLRLTYHQISLNSSSYSFALTPVVRDPNPWVIDAIYYPGTQTGYWFGDTDSYSTYGMLAKVVEQRGMGFSAASLTEQGTVTQGQMTRKERYNYPLYVGDISGTPSSNLTDAPSYTSMIETWTRDGNPNNNDSATTNYLVQENASNPSQPSTPSRKVELTLPNSTKSIQYSFNYTNLPEGDPLKPLDGVVYQDEMLDANNNFLQGSTADWEKGAYDSPRPIRVQATNERSQTTKTEFSYGDFYNQVTDVRKYDYGGAVLMRSTRTEYQNSASYTTNRHIFNLPLVVEVFAADNTTRVSRTEYQYDGQTLADTPGVIMHADNHNPYAPTYNPVTAYRGNITQVTTYADANVPSGAVSQTRRYDINGNMIKASTLCCEQTTVSYTVDTRYGYPLSQTRGSATDGNTQVTTSATYDVNTGLVLSATDTNGRASQTSYFAETLRPQTVTLATGAHTHYVYDDTSMSVTETTYSEPHITNDSAIADQNVKLLNGRGQVRQEKALGAGGIWDLVDVVYDNMGRMSQQSRPYRSGEPRWSTITYDELGRTKKVIAPDYTLPDASDGSATETFYNETNRPSVASTLPGETTRVVDAWGRERWGRTDAQGRLVEVVEPNPSGSGSVATGGLLTTYAYNTLGNLVNVTQGAQTRTFNYDSLGRLTAQKLAETNATLNAVGQYIGAGQWSDVFTYDDRSNLISRTDARGVKTIYNFSNDPLNRLQSVEWNTSGFGDTANPILSAANVNYFYRTKDTPSQMRDVTQLSSVSTTGVSTESYVYDAEGRIESKTLALTNRPYYPFVSNYTYDKLDRIEDVHYPAEYGNGSQPRKVAHHDYDVASRLTGLTVGGQSHASQIAYNASSQTTSLNVGASGPNQMIESYDYDPQTGLLAGQSAARSSTPTNSLLNLSYDYAGANGKRTGQLTKILNNLNHNKDRSYTYDALGRLTQAKGGPAGGTPLWTQTYSYDRYGNRESVSATGYSASNRGSSPRSEPGAVATGSFASTALSAPPPTGPTDPKVVLPTEQLAARTEVELPESLRTDTSRSISDSSFNLGSRSAPATPTTTQSPPVFTDDPLVVGVTVIKAIHVTELRDAVNQARARVALAAAIWTDAALQGVQIKAIHIVELRAKLDDARLVMGLGAASYTDPSLSIGNTVKAVHVQELRARVIEAINAPLGPINLALNKPATQSSTHSDPNHPNLTFAANLAVDGNTNGDIHAGYSAVTTYQMQPWWEMDLGSVQSIGSIQIWGRTDCCPEMTSNFYVLVSDQPFVSTDLATARNQAGVSSYYVPGYSGTPGTININRSARYVRVQMAATHYLVLAEVKVWQSTGSTSIPLDGHANLSYDSATNRITTAGFAYDAAGNQTRALVASGGSQRFQYDAANRLVKVKADDNWLELATYTYGDSKQRLMIEEWGLRTYYASEGGSVLAEYFETGSSTSPAWSKSYIYLGARLLSTLTPNGSGGEATQYHHPDCLGTRLVTNAQDTTYLEQASLPFGTPLNAESTGSTNRRFTSYDRSVTTGLDYAVNRHFDSQQGRFTQVDPIGMLSVSIASPQTLNLYAYCTNDPINHIDPNGLGFFSFLKKLFKGILRVLSNTWVQLAILAVVAVITGPAAGMFFGYTESARHAANSVRLLTGAILSAATAANHWVPRRKKKEPEGPCPPGRPCTVTIIILPDIPPIPPNVMGPGSPDNSSWTRLLWEFISGRGPRDRQFGPDSSMTVELRSSPEVAHQRQEFCRRGSGRYTGGRRFGLNSADGPVRARLNMPRQYVGSFNIAITPRHDGSALFEVTNTTGLKSLLYHIPGVQDIHPSEMRVLSNITQTFWWTERSPCGP